jgi:hypothetical protein
MDIRDNLIRTENGKRLGYLTEEAIVDFEKTLSPDEREARLHGKFLHLTGLIFKEFDPSIHIIDKTGVKKHWFRIMAIDPHPRKPAACLWLAVNEKNELFIYDELLFSGSVADLASAIRAQEGDLIAHRRIIDPSADQEVQLRASIRTELMKNKIWCERGSNDVELGISKIHEALTPDIQNLTGVFDSRLKISRLCPQLITQILHYVWDEYRMRPEEHDPKEKPMPKNEDLITCLRYILVSNPQYHNPEGEEEEAQIKYVGQFAKYPDEGRSDRMGYRDLVEAKKHAQS